MRKFILELLLYMLIPILTILVILELLLRNVPNDYSFKNKWLTENSSKTKILILGTSHTYFGINPDYFEKRAFNAAEPSQTLKYDYSIFNKFHERMDSLEYIILPISFFSLYSKLENVEPLRVKKYFLYYDFKYQEFSYDNCFQLSEINYKNMNSKKWKHLRNTIAGNENDIFCNNLGFGIRYSTKNKHLNWQKRGPIVAQEHMKESDSKTLTENEGYVQSIITMAAKKNIKVILITTPTWQTYSENLNKIQLSYTMKFCNSMKEKFSNVSYINMLNDKRFGETDFYDPDHLCDVGAKKFTKILNDTLRVIF